VSDRVAGATISRETRRKFAGGVGHNGGVEVCVRGAEVGDCRWVLGGDGSEVYHGADHGRKNEWGSGKL